MSDFLDKYGAPEPPPDDILAKVRAAAMQELGHKKKPRAWTVDALMLFGTSFGVFTLVAIALLIAGVAHAEVIPTKLVTIIPLFATAALCAFAALAPRRRGIRIAAVLSALSAALLLLSARPDVPFLGASPQWLCTALHVLAGTVPVVVALLLLRTTAPDPLRAAVAGLSMGTTGALLGELVCEQGLRHVALFHLGAWAIVVALCLGLSRFVRPRSYAP